MTVNKWLTRISPGEYVVTQEESPQLGGSKTSHAADDLNLSGLLVQNAATFNRGGDALRQKPDRGLDSRVSHESESKQASADAVLLTLTGRRSV
jgi:hypothetical protein